MKKIFALLALSLCITFAYAPLKAQQPTAEPAADGTTIVTPSAIPDTACIVLSGERVCFITTDGKAAVEIVQQFFRQNSGSWPKTFVGWLTLFASFIFSASGTALLVNVKRVYEMLKPIFRKTLHIVALVAMAFSYGSTYLIGLVTKDGFNPNVFAVLSMLSSFGAVYIYETWIKKKDPLPIPKPQTPAP